MRSARVDTVQVMQLQQERTGTCACRDKPRFLRTRTNTGTDLSFYVQIQIQGQTLFFSSRFNISHTLKILQIFFKTLFLFFNFP